MAETLRTAFCTIPINDGLGEFDFRGLAAGRVDAIHLFLKAGHPILKRRFFRFLAKR